MAKNLRDRFLNELVIQRNIAAAEVLRKHFVPEAGGDFVAACVSGHNLQGRVRRPVVFEREESKSQSLILRSINWNSWEELISDLDSALFGVLGNTVNHALGAALVDVVLAFENLQSGRRYVKCEVLGNVGSIALQKTSQRIIHGTDGQRRRPILNFVFLSDQAA